MNANEKQILYDFLKTTCDYIDGFKTVEQKPIFTDDIKNLQPEKTKSTYPITELTQMKNQILNCNKCKLCQRRKNVVFGEGPAELAGITDFPTVMVIGEGPGADEDRTGRPFVGRAGQLLDKMLQAINLSRKTNCYIANIVKCRPPNNRNPEPDEISACIPYLQKQIEIVRPKFLLLMGRTAVHSLLNTGEGIGRIHGQMYNYNGIPAMPTYHPSALLHNETLKRPAWEDLKKFRDYLKNGNFK